MKGDRKNPARAVELQASCGAHLHTIDSQALLGAGREIRIRHKGAIYTLRQTRQDKLILTK